MHRALRLPEIVKTILVSEASAPNFLYTCLRVNRLFFFESCRILWSWCGSTIIGHPLGNPRPEVCRLAHIVRMSVERAQIYAGFIRELSFCIEGEYYDGDEARWHSELTKLEYPVLEEVEFLGAPDSTRSLNTEEAVTHYAQPSVRRFALDEGSPCLSDVFLEKLPERCPSLQHLRLNTIGRNNCTPNGLAGLLETTKALSFIEIYTGFEEIWSFRGFQSTSRYLRLEVLDLPRIEDSWIRALLLESPTFEPFPKLVSLRTEVSGYGAAQLARIMPNITHLTLSLSASTDSPSVVDYASPATLLSAGAQFPHLESFEAIFQTDALVTGTELLLLARSCPKLQRLEMHRPRTAGITDELIEDLANSLPSINDLTIKSHNNVSLTFKSLQSLARHCKDLRQLKLSCSSTWFDNASIDQSIMSQMLWHLALIPGYDSTDHLQNRQGSLQQIADCITALGPKLGYFTIEGHYMTEDTLVELASAVCNERMYNLADTE